MKLAMLRNLVPPAVCLAALASACAVCTAAPNLRLENEHYLVEVRLPNGTIARIRDKERGLELLQQPRLASSSEVEAG